MREVEKKFAHNNLLKHKARLQRLSYISLSLLMLFLAGGCVQQTEAPTQIIKYIAANEALNLIQENEDNPDFIIIDVRTPEEFSEGHIANAINIDFNDQNFRDEISKLERDKAYFIYCRSGNRSRGALNIMLELGFKEIYHLFTGIIEWLDKGLPVTK